ncbi:MAG: hypothetical protein KatS3mg056_1797 [Chloroflexus sp.]|nr:MAG: hypothetical protein KatS3mg056_1797 [Chloroflexus sp.]
MGWFPVIGQPALVWQCGWPRCHEAHLSRPAPASPVWSAAGLLPPRPHLLSDVWRIAA